MVGLGETAAEIGELFRVLRDRGVDVLTIGQYLQPDGRSLPVSRYYTPGGIRRSEGIGPGPWFHRGGVRTVRPELLSCRAAVPRR